jgi:hypothetical protein
MAITHKQLEEVFGFQAVKNSAYGIRSYKRYKSGIELFAKKNSIEVIVPGLPIEYYSLEHTSLKELKNKIPKIISSAKKRTETAPPTAADIFIHTIFLKEELGV